MNRHAFTAALALGLLAVIWVAIGFWGSSLVALGMTLVIGLVFGLGAFELHQYRQGSAQLQAALHALPQTAPLTALTALTDWLHQVPQALQLPVRLRIEGERSGLPGPVLTPYLVGLLVMLGMLGTFLGMLVSLHGAAFSLQGSADVSTLRAALAAPIQGLGLAFGTSVAGVATSAMLGLMSVLARRERQGVGAMLDQAMAGALQPFTPGHQRQLAFQALQQQTQLLPTVLQQLQTLVQQMAQDNQLQHTRMQQDQQQFHSQTEAVYSRLASNVAQSLQTSLAHSASTAVNSLTPVLQAALHTLAEQTSLQHERVMQSTQQQLQGVAQRMDQAASGVLAQWQTALAQQTQAHSQVSQGLGDTLTGLAQTAQAREQQWLAALGQAHTQALQARTAQDQQQQQAWLHTLQGLTDQWQAQQAQTAALAQQQHQHLCSTLRDTAHTITAQTQTSASQTLAEISQLLQTAAQAPRAAADMVAQLQDQLSANLTRDNAQLQERNQLMATLDGLLQAMNHTAQQQRSHMDTLLAQATQALQQTGSELMQQMRTESASLGEVAAQVQCSAVDVASLGESFGVAVHTFAASNDALIAHLHRIETALNKAQTRSDDQLAYCVAQAREIIDLSLMSQKQILDTLGQNAAMPSQHQAEPA